MFTDLNQELVTVKENLRKKAKYEEHIDRLHTYLQEEKRKKAQLEYQLHKEKEDVEKLEGFSLANVFYTITGKKLEKLDKEQQEVLAAKLKFTEAAETIADVEKELEEFQRLLAEVSDAESRYKEILTEKEKLIHDTNSVWSVKLFDLAEKEADLEANINEYKEAIGAGGMAEASLRQALSSLDSAKNWSTFDMFGGGMISTHMKHSRLNEAKSYIHDAQRKLRLFKEELMDIKEHFDSTIDVGGMLTFADYFFDGLIVDWMVHGKINTSHEQTSATLSRVSGLVSRLREQQGKLAEEWTAVREEKKAILEETKI